MFSYSHYLSLLIARGEVKSPIIPLLPFAKDGEGLFHSRPDPDPELSLSISLPALKKARLDPGEVATPTGPISPSDASGSFSIGGPQDDISFTALNMIGGGGGPFVCEIESSGEQMENTTVALLRQQKLESLLTANMESSRSPIPFHSHDDGPASPMGAGFPLFPSGFIEEDNHHSLEPAAAINKQLQRHLLYTAYFPFSDMTMMRQELSKRTVVLYGVGKSRSRVEKTVKGIMENVEHYFRLLQNVSSPVLPDNPRCPDLMQKFCLLPTFEQRVIALECEKRLRLYLHDNKGQPNVSICAQLVFVCELLEISGGILQILDLLTDVICGDSENDSLPGKGGVGHTPCLPPDLCLPVLCLLRKYLSCLLLSQEDTAVIFEGCVVIVVSANDIHGHCTVLGMYMYIHVHVHVDESNV